MPELPKISIWVTVGQREFVRRCFPSFGSQCHYPNIEYLFALYLPTDPHGNRAWVEGLECPGKRIIETSDKTLAQTYKMLIAESAEWFLNIGDDFLFGCDPTPMMIDGINLLMSVSNVCAVRMTSHTPLVLDVQHPDFVSLQSVVGPVVWGFSVSDTQHLCRTKDFGDTPGVYDQPDGWRSIQTRNPLWKAGMGGVTMLRYWGCSVHIGDTGEDGQVSKENQISAEEAEVICRRRLFWLRDPSALYSTGIDEDLRRQIVYPLFVIGCHPLVAGQIPLSYQKRLGPSLAQRIV